MPEGVGFAHLVQYGLLFFLKLGDHFLQLFLDGVLLGGEQGLGERGGGGGVFFEEGVGGLPGLGDGGEEDGDVVGYRLGAGDAAFDFQF